MLKSVVRLLHGGWSCLRCLAVVLALWTGSSLGLSLPAEAQAYEDIPVTVRVGYTTHPLGVPEAGVAEAGNARAGADPTLDSLTAYVEFLSEQSRRHPYFLRRLDFELAPGNEYQVYEWLRNEQLDAAVVSPFTAWLLERSGIARPVLELAGYPSVCPASEPWNQQGHRPMIQAIWPQGVQDEPAAVYESFLGRLRRRVTDASPGDGEELEFELRMASHLSTSQFLYPLLYAADWLQRTALESDSERVLSGPGEERFWRTLLDKVVFDLHAVHRADGDSTHLHFAHSGAPPAASASPALLASAVAAPSVAPAVAPGEPPATPSVQAFASLEPSGPPPGWECYWTTGGPWIPNDVVVVRYDWDDEHFYSGPDDEDKDVRALLPGASWVADHLQRPGGAYTDILDYEPERHEPFRRAVENLFSRPHLRERLATWYLHGDFDFTLEDTLQFLKPGRPLGLVLPGGGVKSTYQAAVLDHLYGEPLLFNSRARRPPETAPGLPLRVDRIVGTSGGAMMGFFASQIDGTPCLSRLWLDPEGSLEPGGTGGTGDPEDPCGALALEAVSATALFDVIDFPRWLSLLVLLLILVFTTVAIGWVSSVVATLFGGLEDWMAGLARGPADSSPRDSSQPSSPMRARWSWGWGRLAALFAGCRRLALWVHKRLALEGPKRTTAGPGPHSSDRGGETSSETAEMEALSMSRHPEAAWLAVMFALVAPLVAPFLVSWLRGPRVEQIPQIEGLLFAALVALGHMILVCAKPQPVKTLPWRTWRTIPLVVAFLAAGGLVATPFWVAARGGACWTFADGTLSACSLSVLLGLLLIQVVVLVAPRAGIPYQLRELRKYWQGIGILVAYFVAVYLVMAGLTWLGWATPLEVTLVFWQRLMLVGFALSILLVAWILVVVHRERPRWLVSAIRFSVRRQRLGGVVTTARRSFLYMFVLGLFLWNGLNAPALYGNERMRSFFHQRIESFRAYLEEISDEDELKLVYDEQFGTVPELEETRELLDLKVPLVVTGVLLGQAQGVATGRAGADGCRELDPGEIFFCFDATGDCPSERGSRWKRFEDFTQDQVADAVVASGSPFPIFAAHPVSLPNDCKIDLVDGGYTNNVPLEAADLAGVEQALIVYSQPVTKRRTRSESEALETGGTAKVASQQAAQQATKGAPGVPAAPPGLPREMDEETTLADWIPAVPAHGLNAGPLVRYSGRLFPFLFERAQEIDRRVAQGMVVVSLAPLAESSDGSSREFPGLADFRKQVIRELDGWAQDDLTKNRRIGRVESWGQPVVTRIVRDGRWLQESTQRIQLPSTIWDDEVRRALKKSVTAEAPVERKVAVIDLDGTCLDGDLGAWLFAEMVVTRSFRGDDPDFWRDLEGLVGEDERELVTEARTLWDEHRETWGNKRFALENPDDWEDSERRFVGHFRRLQETRRLAGDLEVLHAHLWDGFEEEEIQTFTRRVLDTLPTNPVRQAGLDGDSGPWQPWLREVGALRELIAGLHRLGWTVWLVGDAVEPAVQAAAEVLGVPQEQALGFTVNEATAGPPLRWPHAKAHQLNAKGIDPWLVVADGAKDVPLLRAARGLAVVIDHGEVDRAQFEDRLAFFQTPFPAARPTGLKMVALGTSGNR